MKIFSLTFLAVAAAQGTENMQTGHDRFERAFGLLDDWIEENVGDWKKRTKLENRLDWMAERLASNLNDGCVLMPSQDDLDDIDNVNQIYFLDFFYIFNIY